VTVRLSTPTVTHDPYAQRMEFLLLWWDDLDDLTHACRHLATSAISEVTATAAPFVTSLAAACAWLLLRFPV
jgi:hypothetical protein